MTRPVRPMARQLRHDVWATEQLIARCRELSDQQLALTVPGTFGTIRLTLQHIVSADLSYLDRLGITVGGELDDERDVALEQTAARMADVHAGVERFLSGPDFDPERPLPRRRGGTVPAWVLVAQFVHHGSDHRAQIGTILGAHGLDTPELDVWAYSASPELSAG